MHDTELAAAETLPMVVAAGVRLARFERVRPTLEDVFLQLVGAETPGRTLERRGRMNGLGLLVRKELREQVRTLRLPVIVILFAILGMLSPVFARYIRRSSPRWAATSSPASSPTRWSATRPSSSPRTSGSSACWPPSS